MPTHKKTESERFKGPAKYAEYLFARALITGLQHLPIGLAYRLGRIVGWLAWKCLKRRRATVRKNLEIVNKWRGAQGAGRREQGAESEHRTSNIEHSTPNQPQKTQVSGLKSHPSSPSSLIPHPSSLLEPQVRAVFLRAGANLFAGFTFNRMSPEQAARHIEIEGLDHLKAALAEGKGAIILLGHMGPWEALTQLPGMARRVGIDAPFGSIYRALNNYYLDNWYLQQREAQGTRMFLSRYKFFAPADFVRGGGILGILSDQRASGGERVQYFGQSTRATPLPGLLQQRAQTSMIGLSFKTTGRARWQLRLRAERIHDRKERRSRAELAQDTASAMEALMLESVCDGFWFSDRFKDATRGDDRKGTKRIRT